MLMSRKTKPLIEADLKKNKKLDTILLPQTN